MKRILITGNSGAGKTTLARKLAEKYNIPLIHLDSIFWTENWGSLDKETFRRKVTEIVEKDEWVIEGNYASTFDIRFPRATDLYHLDYSGLYCIMNLLKRRLHVGSKPRVEMAKGCNEKIEYTFYKFVLEYPRKHSPVVYESAKKLFNGNFRAFKSRKDLNNYMSEKEGITLP